MFVAIIALVLGAIALLVSFTSSDDEFAGVNVEKESFVQGFTVGSDETEFVDANRNITNAVDITATGDMTVGGGSFTLTTSNGATSTAIMGCIQGYATSTATPVRMTFSPFAGTTTTQGGTSDFLVAGQYGSCPI